jgi:hypothetical protein
MKKPASILLFRHHQSDRQRDGRQITTSPELSNFSNLQNSLPEAKPLLLKKSDRGTHAIELQNWYPPPPTTVSGEEIKTADLHPQTHHRIHHLPSVTYADKRLRVLLDNTSSLLHHDVGPNTVVTGTEQEDGHTWWDRRFRLDDTIQET